MPRFDLAGNPLPDVPVSAPPPPHAAIPPRQDPQGRTTHTAPAPTAPRPVPMTPPAPASSLGNPGANAGPVRYDLAGNPIASAPATPSYTAPPSYAGSTQAGTWPPPPGGMAQGYQPYMQNTSGEQGDVPPEIARLRWHWGAFFFPIFWSKKHGMTTVAAILGGCLIALRVARNVSVAINPAIFPFLIVIYAVSYLGIAIYFGLTGHKHGWRNRRFNDVQDYLSCQTKWMWWGFGINALTSVILPILIFAGLIGLGMSASHNARYNGSGYSAPYGSGSAAPADSSGGQ